MLYFVFVIAIVLIVVNYIKNKHQSKKIIKTKKVVYLAKPKIKKFTSICLIIKSLHEIKDTI